MKRDWLAIVRTADPDFDAEANVVIDYRFGAPRGAATGTDGNEATREFKHRQNPGEAYPWVS